MDIFGAEFDPSRPSMQGLPFLSPMKDLLASLPDDKPVKTRKSRRTLVLMKNGQDDAGNEDGVGSQESDSVGDESGGVADADNDEEEDEVDADASTVADEDEDDREADFMDEDKNLGEEGTEPRHEEDEDGEEKEDYSEEKEDESGEEKEDETGEFGEEKEDIAATDCPTDFDARNSPPIGTDNRHRDSLVNTTATRKQQAAPPKRN